MHLADCVSKVSSHVELLIVFSEDAHEAARDLRDRMAQAVLPIISSFVLEDELANFLVNDDCQSLNAAIGVGIQFGGSYASSEPLFDVTKLRYGKIIVVTQPGEIERSGSGEVLRFFFKHMRPLIDGGHIFALETPLPMAFTQDEFVEHVLNPVTRRLRVMGSEDELDVRFRTPNE